MDQNPPLPPVDGLINPEPSDKYCLRDGFKAIVLFLKTPNGSPPLLEHLSGIVDVIGQFAIHLDQNGAFQSHYKALCESYEDYHYEHNPSAIDAMESAIEALCQDEPQIAHGEFISIISGLLHHIQMHLGLPDTNPPQVGGELIAISSLISMSALIQEHTKLKAHKVCDLANHWVKEGASQIPILAHSIEELFQDLDLMN